MRLSKVDIAALVMIGFLLVAQDAHAGPFLDLSIGHVVGPYKDSACAPTGNVSHTFHADGTFDYVIECEDRSYIGGSGWVGVVRAGYRTPAYTVGRVHVTGEGYVLHISDPKVGHDYGMDAVMVGVGFEYK